MSKKLLTIRTWLPPEVVRELKLQKDEWIVVSTTEDKEGTIKYYIGGKNVKLKAFKGGK